jgi:zinc transport system substrate-binding protein
MKKSIILIFIIAMAIIGLGILAIFGMESKVENKADSADTLSVVASFYPLYFFASEIGGEHVDVQNLTPPGVEPHEYEPTPQDIIAIEKSDLLVLNGSGFEPWGEDVITNFGSKKPVVLAGENLAVLTVESGDGDHNEITDPHVWLSPTLALQIVERIRDGLISTDPENESEYRANAEHLIAELNKLDLEFENGLKSCARRNMVTLHAAFAYLAKDYNLNQIAILGVTPEEEPSAKELAKIVEFVRQNDVKYIFFETLAPSAFSETIAREVEVETLSLNPLEGLTQTELSQDKNYFTEMRQNLLKIKIALECR